MASVVFFIDENGIGVIVDGEKIQAEHKFTDQVIAKLESSISKSVLQAADHQIERKKHIEESIAVLSRKLDQAQEILED